MIQTEQQPIRVIARNSPLSLKQVDEVFANYLHGLDYSLLSFKSYGDLHKEVSLMDNIPADFFTRELDNALRNGEADIAIHSAKDLPFPMPEGMEIYALLSASDKSDSLVSTGNKTLKELPYGARIATSSPKRKSEIKRIRPDLETVSVRGTIEERIEQLDRGDFDALIVASCALQRLGLENRITEKLPFETHPLQGHIAITIRKGDEETRLVLDKHINQKTDLSKTLAYYISSEEIAGKVQSLISNGVPENAKTQIITYCSQNRQRVFTFGINELTHTAIKTEQPILMTVFPSLPHVGGNRKVLSTGTSSQWAESRGLVTSTPLIQTMALDNILLPDLSKYEIIIFTSRHAVKYFAEKAKKQGIALSSLANAYVISIGAQTSLALSKIGLKPDFQPDIETAEEIIKHLRQKGIAGKQILLPRSSIGINSLPEELTKSGGHVTDLPIYNTMEKRDATKLNDITIFDEILFSSPSGVRAFVSLYGNLPDGIPLSAKGKTTADEILKFINKA